MQGLDFALNEASKRGIRLVLVFANYWSHFGGIDQYNTWSFQAGAGAYPSHCVYCTVLLLWPSALSACTHHDVILLIMNIVFTSSKQLNRSPKPALCQLKGYLLSCQRQ